MKGKSVGRLGCPGYARLLAAIVRQPLSPRGLAATGLVGLEAGGRFCAYLHSVGTLHIADWELPPDQKRMPIYAYGPGKDAPVPTRRPNGDRYRGGSLDRFIPRPDFLQPELIAFNEALVAMQEPITAPQIAAESGLFIRTAWSLIDTLTEEKLIYVADWLSPPRGGSRQPLFHWGPGKKSKAKPPRKTRAELQREADAAKRMASVDPFARMAIQLGSLQLASLAANDSEARIRA